MIARHVETVFCDDVRFEVSGKAIYIGVYANFLLVEHFPAQLPKLCVIVKVVTPFSHPFKSLKVRVLKGEEIMKEIEVDDADLAVHAKNLDSVSEDDAGIRINIVAFNFELSSLDLVGPCTLRVRAITEDGEMAGSGLIVRQLQSDDEEASPKT